MTLRQRRPELDAIVVRIQVYSSGCFLYCGDGQRGGAERILVGRHLFHCYAALLLSQSQGLASRITDKPLNVFGNKLREIAHALRLLGVRFICCARARSGRLAARRCSLLLALALRPPTVGLNLLTSSFVNSRYSPG